jgi:FBP C-terminal treble-clef zinc-finger
MQPVSESTIRASLVNASQRERGSLTLPALETVAWDRLTYLGWRDAKIPSLGYVIVELEEGPTGILLRAAEGRARSRAQCSWCEDVQLPNDVALFSAKRSGAAGRNGNTVGTLICAEFECSANVRRRPAMAYIGFDIEAAREHRIAALGDHARAFARDIRDGS